MTFASGYYIMVTEGKGKGVFAAGPDGKVLRRTDCEVIG